MSNNEIPPITDPLGRAWSQPSTSNILIDDTHAVISQTDFDKLLEYSASVPSGTYAGKMWKRLDGSFSKPKEECTWMLCWYGHSEKGPDYCSINFREALIV